MENMFLAAALTLLFTNLATADEATKGYRLEKAGDKLLEQRKHRDALKVYLQAKKELSLAQSFGRTGYATELLMRLGNAYALTGDASKAVNYYWMSLDRTGCEDHHACEANLTLVESRDASMPKSQLETRRQEVIRSFEGLINRCETCKSSLTYWNSLANLCRATGDAEKAKQTEAELMIHREANAAWDKAQSKGAGSPLLDTLAAVAAGYSGKSVPKATDEQMDAKMAVATRKAWHAKMVVYQKYDRSAYVARTVQEMKGSR